MDKKNGFTLIEIMVVIVIMGILAAVGVPKLFGMIAKAKAAEVPTAAGIYVRLQDAFVHNDHGIGSWKDIGYAAPGDGKTNNFEYGDCVVAKKEIDKDAESFLGWSATNLSALNECSARSAWGIIIDPVAESTVNFTQVVSSQECASLTSNWPVGSVDASACSAGATQTAEPDPKVPEPQQQAATDTGGDDDGDDGSDNDSDGNGQPDCQALKDNYNNDHGKKKGWVYYPGCGTSVPPGIAKDLPGCTKTHGNDYKCE